MGRLRSFFRRAAKPAVMVMVAMSLSVSLVVTTPSNAQATTIAASLLRPPPILLGSGAMPIGAALRLVAPFAGPLGWTFLGVSTVAAGLVATQDYWLPYVKGAFGDAVQGTKDETTPTTGYANPREGLIVQNPVPFADGSGLTVTVTYHMVRSGNWYYDSALQCKRPDGSIYNVSRQGSYAYSASTTVGIPCTSVSDDVVAGQVGGICALTVSYTTTKCTSKTSYYGPANVVTWGEGGRPAFDPESPEVKYKSTVECVRPDGTLFELSAESTGDQKAVKMPSCAAAVPGSHATGKTLVEGFPPGVTQPDKLYESPAIGNDPDYPLCGVNRPGPLCKLAVQIDTKECVVGNWDCVNWSELSKDPTHSPRVSCQYGPYSVPVEKCNPLERAYEEGGAPANEPNTDGNPGTRSDMDPKGQQIPKTSPSNGTVPGTSTGPVPGGAGQPQPTETNKTECWPNGWGMFDPSWFLDAMKCAFEPTPNVDAKISNMNQSFSNKAPFVWVAGAGAVVAGSANVSGSCPDWTINVAGLSENVVCESSFTQAILSSRGALFGLMVIGMFWPLIRSIWYSVIPILRPAPIG